MSSLIIAAAGAGKTTFLVKKALEISENVLITTYTDANEQSIRDKFYEINGCIPSNVTIMPWFSLLQMKKAPVCRGSKRAQLSECICVSSRCGQRLDD